MTERPNLPAAVRSTVALLAASLAWSCAGEQPVEPQRHDRSPAERTRLAEIHCQASAAGLDCAPVEPAGGELEGPEVAGQKTNTLGGQGRFVTLSGTVTQGLDGDDGTTWNVDVDIQNLVIQPMGTTNSDGSATGADDDIKVFFVGGSPTCLSDCTTVEVANEDGTGNFTAPNQPYFQWTEGTDYGADFLDTDETTGTRTWQFSLTGEQATSSFEFFVYVEANLPHESSVFTSTDQSTGSDDFRSVFGVSSSEAWAVDGAGGVVHTTDGGTTWSAETSNTSNRLNGVWAADGTNQWAVGDVQSDWFDTDWPKRKQITVQSGQVAANLSDFPVFVDLSTLGSDFFSSVQSDGADIRVTMADGTTLLPREVVSIDTGAETGELHFEASALSGSANTTFYVYYGNGSASAPAVTDPNGRNAVWANGYEAVFHLSEASGATSATDATGNGLDLTTFSGTVDPGAAGQVGTAYDLDNQGYAEAGTSFDPPQQGTVTFWLNPDFVGGCRCRPVSSANSYETLVESDGAVEGNRFVQDFATESTTTLANGTWYYISDLWNFASGSVNRLYIDATEEVDATEATSDPGTSVTLRVGPRSGEETQDWDGQVDEVRHANVFRSADWITTAHNNQSSPGTFYSVGSEEDAAGTVQSCQSCGGTWAGETSDVGRELNDVHGASTSNVWAVGNSGAITHFDGTSWSAQTSGTASDLNGVWAAGASDVWAVGAGGTIRRTTDGGATWSDETSPVATALNDVWGSGTDDVWTVGDGGVLLQRTSGSWSEDGQSGSLTVENLLAVFGNGSSDVFAVGANGTLLHYDGTDWMIMASRAGTTTLRGVWTADAVNGWIAGDGGTIRAIGR